MHGGRHNTQGNEPAKSLETSKSLNGLSPVSHALATAREGAGRDDDDTAQLSPMQWLSEKWGLREREREERDRERHLSQGELSLGHFHRSPQMHPRNGPASASHGAGVRGQQHANHDASPRMTAFSGGPFSSTPKAKPRNVYQAVHHDATSTAPSLSSSLLLPETPRNVDTLPAAIERARPHKRDSSMSNSSGEGLESGSSGAAFQSVSPFPARAGGDVHPSMGNLSRLSSGEVRAGPEDMQEGDRLYRSGAQGLRKLL